jgi:hypothetical protein
VGGANLLTLFLFACYLDPAVFGVFLLAFAALLLMSRMQSALLTEPHDAPGARPDPAAQRRYTGELVALQATSCLVPCVILAAAGWLVSFYSPPAGHVLIALALTAVPWLGQLFVRRVLRARGEARAVAIGDSVTYGLQVFGALVLVTSAAGWATPASALSVLALSSAVGLATGCWFLRKHASFEPGGARAYRKAWTQLQGFIPARGASHFRDWRARVR